MKTIYYSIPENIIKELEKVLNKRIYTSEELLEAIITLLDIIKNGDKNHD